MAIIVQDSFNRVDNTSTLGNANTGQPWTQFNSSLWGIIGNQAYLATRTNNDTTVIESGISDAKISVDIKLGSNEGIVFRATDDSNYLLVNITTTSTTFFRRQGGSYTSIGSVSVTRAVGTTYRLEITCEGSAVTVKVDGSTVITNTSTFNQTATKHGLRNGSTATTQRFDNFLVESLGGGTPVGTDGSSAFDIRPTIYSDSFATADTKQALYTDLSVNTDIRNVLYSDSSTPFDTLQQLYESGVDGSISFDLLVKLYQDLSASSDTKQTIYNENSTPFDSKQVLYMDSSNAFDMLQEYFSDGIIGSIPFDIRLILYSDQMVLFDSKQSMYQYGAFVSDLEQQIYQSNQNNLDMKLVIYSDTFINTDTKQQFYTDNFIPNDTRQSLYQNNNVIFDLRNELYQQTSFLSDARQSIYQDSTVSFPLLLQMYKSGQIDVDTLQMILDGFSEYKQIFKYILSINDSPNQYELDIVRKLQSNIMSSGTRKSFDLKI